MAYRNWKHLSREYEEDFNLQNENFSRTELGHPGRYRYDNHNVHFNYNYQENKKIINFSLGTAIQNAPYKEWNSDLHYKGTALNLYDNAKSSATNPYSQLYIQLPIGENQLYVMNLSGHTTKGNTTVCIRRQTTKVNPTNSAVMSVRFKKAMRCRNYTRTGRIGEL